MNTRQLERVLSADKFIKSSFIGVFPCDTLNFKPTFPSSLVVNTDPSWRPGEHWVSLYIDNNNNIEYFDSYGFLPTNKKIAVFFSENGAKHKYNNRPL